jgi:hypothetical protein
MFVNAQSTNPELLYIFGHLSILLLLFLPQPSLGHKIRYPRRNVPGIGDFLFPTLHLDHIGDEEIETDNEKRPQRDTQSQNQSQLGLCLHRFAFKGLIAICVALLASSTVKNSEAVQTVRGAHLADETIVVVVAVYGLTSVVSGVELAVLSDIAGEAVPILITGETVVATVGALRHFLAKLQQRSQTFVKAGAVPAQVVAIVALGTDCRRQTVLAFRRAFEAKGIFLIVEVPIQRLASESGFIEYPVIRGITGQTNVAIFAGEAVVGAGVAVPGGDVGEIPRGTGSLTLTQGS